MVSGYFWLNLFCCQDYGHKAAFYHGSMDSVQRASVQKQWSKDEINIICATVAFGMGTNKTTSDVVFKTCKFFNLHKIFQALTSLMFGLSFITLFQSQLKATIRLFCDLQVFIFYFCLVKSMLTSLDIKFLKLPNCQVFSVFSMFRSVVVLVEMACLHPVSCTTVTVIMWVPLAILYCLIHIIFACCRNLLFFIQYLLVKFSSCLLLVTLFIFFFYFILNSSLQVYKLFSFSRFELSIWLVKELQSRTQVHLDLTVLHHMVGEYWKQILKIFWEWYFRKYNCLYQYCCHKFFIKNNFFPGQLLWKWCWLSTSSTADSFWRKISFCQLPKNMW